MKVQIKLCNQWVAIASILICLTVIIFLANFTTFHDYYGVHVWGTQLQKDLGFRAGVCGPSGLSNQHAFCTTDVIPGGVFSKAGVKVGYIPFGYQHGFASGFYSHLQSARDSSATVMFLKVGKNNEYYRHKIEISVPR